MSEDLPVGEKRARKLRERQRERALRREAMFRELMGRIDFREFIWDTLADANVFTQSFTPGQPDTTAFLEGKRAAGLGLLAFVTRVTPQAYLRMTTENSGVPLDQEENDDE